MQSYAGTSGGISVRALSVIASACDGQRLHSAADLRWLRTARHSEACLGHVDYERAPIFVVLVRSVLEGMRGTVCEDSEASFAVWCVRMSRDVAEPMSM